ncbi:MAG: glycosyltransferase family 4 protein [Flavobacterium sp.]|nr:glycosyltransferase family 4 protein [Flavobacterium sp.]
MKILLDNIIYSTSKQGGISNYWFELSKYLLKQSGDDVVFFEELGVEKNFHRGQLEIPPHKIIRNPNSQKSSILRRLASVNPGLDEPFLFHSSYYRSKVKGENVKQVTTVHDFTHNYYASFLKKAVHNNLKYNSIRKSSGIICISENTFKDLRKFCPPSKNQKVAIIHNGVGDEYHVLDRSDAGYANFLRQNGIQTDYLLYIGSRAPYKNFKLAAALANKLRNFQLVIIGEELTQEEKKLFDEDALRRTVTISNVNNDDLNVFYNFAYAFVYPSAYEGFGIPIIEAMRAGCPVLALDNSSITEVAGGAAMLFEKANIDDFKKAIIKLENLDFKHDLIEKGKEHSASYSWEKCCRETHEFYGMIY